MRRCLTKSLSVDYVLQCSGTNKVLLKDVLVMQINVMAGNGINRTLVGYVQPTAGMLTNKGRISKVTEKSVFCENSEGDTIVIRNLDGVYTRHSEAVRCGYPQAEGSTRLRHRNIRRGERTIVA